MARRRVTRSPARPRRRYEWARAGGQATFNSTNAAGVSDLLTNFQEVLGADAAGVTITRIRGHVDFVYTGAELAAAGNQAPARMSFGIRVATDMPDDITDTQVVQLANQRYADWMYYEPAYHVFPSAETDAMVTPEHVTKLAVDIKAQRRFDELQQSLFTFISWQNVSGTAGVDVAAYWSFNILLKMP